MLYVLTVTGGGVWVLKTARTGGSPPRLRVPPVVVDRRLPYTTLTVRVYHLGVNATLESIFFVGVGMSAV